MHSAQTPGGITHMLSYPKSGRTWLRTLIGKYLCLKYSAPEQYMLATEQLTQHCGLPPATFSHDGSAMIDKVPAAAMPTGRSAYAGARVMLLVRDIKDTLVSAYFQANRRIHVFEGDIAAFVRSETYGVHKIVRFYQIWEASAHIPAQFLCLQYEDMHANPLESVQRTLNFMGEAHVDAAALQQSIAYCAFENLRRLEAQNNFKDDRLQAGNPGDQESFKVRRGKVGGYTDYLNQADIAYINDVLASAQFSFQPLLNASV